MKPKTLAATKQYAFRLEMDGLDEVIGVGLGNLHTWWVEAHVTKGNLKFATSCVGDTKSVRLTVYHDAYRTEFTVITAWAKVEQVFVDRFDASSNETAKMSLTLKVDELTVED